MQHVVFGRVLEGMETLKKLESKAATADGTPAAEVTIKNCGELPSNGTDAAQAEATAAEEAL
jgi:peptidyl-prolyl cis-trans isomerase B (cyclophilin B)